MAERQFYATIDQAEKFFHMLLDDGCVILRDLPQKEDRLPMITHVNIREALEYGLEQYFIKHPSFSECIFKLYKINNIHQGEIYIQDDRNDDGQLEILYFPKDGNLHVGYDSFFSYQGRFIDPSPELKNYYKRALAMARKIGTPVTRKSKGAPQ